MQCARMRPGGQPRRLRRAAGLQDGLGRAACGLADQHILLRLERDRMLRGPSRYDTVRRWKRRGERLPVAACGPKIYRVPFSRLFFSALSPTQRSHRQRYLGHHRPCHRQPHQPQDAVRSLETSVSSRWFPLPGALRADAAPPGLHPSQVSASELPVRDHTPRSRQPAQPDTPVRAV